MRKELLGKKTQQEILSQGQSTLTSGQTQGHHLSGKSLRFQPALCVFQLCLYILDSSTLFHLHILYS